MVGKWKESGNWKTIKVSTVTMIIGIILTLIVSQASGMLSWKSKIDSDIAVLQEKVADSSQKVDSFEARVVKMDDKLTKIYELMIQQNSKKK